MSGRETDAATITYADVLAAFKVLEAQPMGRRGPQYIVPPYAYKRIKARLEAGELLSEQMIYEALVGPGSDER